jgi:(p)ppGpp synthase/HD superfamily hydrolase
MANDLLKVLKAADTAAHWHAGQKRKGASSEPYINHLIEVARLVAGVTNGDDPNLVAAALLHDAIEDQNISRATIAEMFGEDVASLVEEVTDDKSLPTKERKRLQVENAPKKSGRAKILKLADKISNVRAIGSQPPRDWTPDRRRDYVQWARDVVAGLGAVSPLLEQQFEQVARDADRSLEASA